MDADSGIAQDSAASVDRHEETSGMDYVSPEGAGEAAQEANVVE